MVVAANEVATDGETRVLVQEADFDVSEELARMRLGSPQTGAIATFVGIVRDVNEHRDVGSMFLEHYPGMTESSIEAIVMQARERWDLHSVTVIHRVGTLNPTEQIVLVAVGGSHRGETIEACEFVMDYLKTRAPFWKRESTSEGERWVASRYTDSNAARRWLAEK